MLSRCYCARLPSAVRLPIDTTIVVHHHERYKPSSTVRLLARVAHAETLALAQFGGRDDAPLGPRVDALAATPGAALLFPAEPGEFVVEPADVRALIVPDGTWAQAKRVVRRWPGFMTLPRVALGPIDRGALGPTVRTPRHADELDTLSAIALFFERRGDADVVEPLRRAHRALLSAQRAWVEA